VGTPGPPDHAHRASFPYAMASLRWAGGCPPYIQKSLVNYSHLTLVDLLRYSPLHTMRRFTNPKLFSWLLLAVMLTASIHCVFENAYASEGQGVGWAHRANATLSDQISQCQILASDHCPCCPAEHQNDSADCDTCINCICHASLTVQHFSLSYNPFILDLQTSAPFQHIPEVYLAKFIPPQNLA
jgi:hypothetical protein